MMNIENQIKRQRPVLTIATPAKAQVHSKYALSLLSSTNNLSKHYDVIVDILPGKSNIIHARSIMLTRWFDKSSINDLFLFIDSDHLFTADDILHVINQPNCDISCGVYVSAANTPNCYPVNRPEFPKDNRAYFCGTGFMLIRKPICKKMYKWIKTNDKVDRVSIDNDNPNSIPFFRTRFAKNPYPDSKQKGLIWLGEDYSFCWLARKVGGTIRAVPLPTMGHEVLQVKYFGRDQNQLQNQLQNPNKIQNVSNPMKELLTNKKEGKKWSRGSVVYFCGFSRVIFSPETPKLGGSEKAVVNIAREWTKLGYDVTIYGNVVEGLYEGVKYLTTDKFNINDRFDTLILWRGFGIPILGEASARNILIDFHDRTNMGVFPEQWFTKLNKAFVKSEWQKEILYNIPENKYVIIENGLENVFKEIQEISHTEEAHNKRNPLRFCYTSCYTRGLDKLLTYLWPLITNKYPEAELHLYYGMDLVEEKEKLRMTNLINLTDNVTDHGRVSIDVLNESRSKSTYQLYLTEWSEIDCLSIREHCMAGCIPIISNVGVYKSRTGFHIDGDTFDQKHFLRAFQQICKLIDDPEKIAEQRDKINYEERYWEDIAKEWVKLGDFGQPEKNKE